MYLFYFIFIFIIQKSVIFVFNDAAVSSEFIVSSETLIDKQRTGKDAEGNGPGITY
jgi:hypothetical protein